MTPVEVDINGTVFTVAFPIGALREFETLTNTSFLNGTAQQKVASIDGVILICWIGVKWGKYKMDGIAPKSKYSVLELSDFIPIDELANETGCVRKVLDVMRDSMPKAKKNVEGDVPS